MLLQLLKGRHFLGQQVIQTTRVHVRVSFIRRRYLSTIPKRFVKSFSEEENRSSGVERLLASFLIKHGTKFDSTKVLESLPQLPADHHLHLDSALFLVTPSLAHLFDPGSVFHASAINHIFGQPSSRNEPQSLVAIVDAIPNLIKGLDQNPTIFGYEGISVCISRRFNAQPVEHHGRQVPLISFHHQKATTKDSVRETAYMAPLANTLFVNGFQNTMIQQNWVRDSQNAWVEDPGSTRTHLKRIDININYDAQDPYTTIMHNRLEQLTEPAVVKSSMGNIISGLQNLAGTTSSASAELEKVVPQFLKARREAGHEGELRIFALVYHPSSSTIGEDVFKNLVANIDSKSETGRTWLNRRNLHNLLKNGGRLYRVTSGGGGWGKKAGLLSLEPTVDICQQPEADNSTPEFTFGHEGVEMPKPKQLIPQGSLIQFLGTFLNPEESQEIAEVAGSALTDVRVVGSQGWNSDAWYNGALMHVLCIGTSTVSDAPGSTAQTVSLPVTDNANSHDHNSSTITFLPNRFGFLSALPMGISTTFRKAPVTTSSSDAATHSESSESLLADGMETSHPWTTHTTLVEAPGTSFVSGYRVGRMFYKTDPAKEGSIRLVKQRALWSERVRRSRSSPSRADHAKKDVETMTAAITSLESRLTELTNTLEKQLTSVQTRATKVRQVQAALPTPRRIIKPRLSKSGPPGYRYRLDRARNEYDETRIRKTDVRKLRISKFETEAPDERAQREQELGYQRANQKEHYEFLQRIAVEESADKDLDAAGARLINGETEVKTYEAGGRKRQPDVISHSILGSNRDRVEEQQAIHELLKGLNED